MAIELRPYQKDAIAAIRADWSNGAKRVLCAMPTGSGKTWLFVFLIFSATRNGNRCMVLVRSDEQVEQTVDKLGRVGVLCGIVKADRNEWTRQVVVASVQTLSKRNRIGVIPKNYFTVVIVDECHFANAMSYQFVLDWFSNAWMLGVTATPFRGDKASLADAGWECVSYVYTMDQAVKDGWLVPLGIERVNTSVELRKTRKARDPITGEEDFVRSSLAKLVNTDDRNRLIVDAYLERMRGVRVIAFCATVEHAWALANGFRRRGVRAQFVHGSTPRGERHRVLEQHRNGVFDVLTNCNVLTHGYDDPSLQGVIMARPTQSKVLYVQSVGRGLRPWPGKTQCHLLDVVDVTTEHSITITSEVFGLKQELGQDSILGEAKQIE